MHTRMSGINNPGKIKLSIKVATEEAHTIRSLAKQDLFVTHN